MHVTIVIPTLDEATALPATIATVAAQNGPTALVIADGGSHDGTLGIGAERAPFANVLSAPRGRAAQMNAGAAHARSAAPKGVLLFLHADTHLPPGALDAIRDALEDPTVLGGCFAIRFDGDHPLYRLYGSLARLPLAALTFGDRAFFVRRSAFEAVGGFPSQPIFEDIAFYGALARYARQREAQLVRLPLAVTTSARRFEARGALRQQMRNAALWLAYHLGVSPHHLARHYRYGARDGTR